MKILALEFSSAQRSVAVVQDEGAPGNRECEVLESGTQSNQPLRMIEQALRLAAVEREEITGLAVGMGPGSYTGIRSAIALAQGWQLGGNIKVAGVSSADCLAAQAQAEGITGRIAVVIDAQRGEFYMSNYELERSIWRETEPLRLATLDAIVLSEAKGELLVGPDATRWFARARAIFPRASILGKLALKADKWGTAEQLAPLYLRQTTFVKAPPPRTISD